MQCHLKKKSNYFDDVKPVITTHIALKWACLTAGLLCRRERTSVNKISDN